MKESEKKFIEAIKANMGTVSKVLREHLGITGEPFMTVRKNRYGEVYVYIEEDEETTRQLTATPLLRQMFKKAGLCIRCWGDGGDTEILFAVNVYYDHYYSAGSNGVELMKFSINLATGEVRVRKDRK